MPFLYFSATDTSDTLWEVEGFVISTHSIEKLGKQKSIAGGSEERKQEESLINSDCYGTQW